MFRVILSGIVRYNSRESVVVMRLGFRSLPFALEEGTLTPYNTGTGTYPGSSDTVVT